MARHRFDVILRLSCVIGVAGLITAGTRAPALQQKPAQAAPSVSSYRPGDLVPASVHVISDDGYGRSYGIAIIEGETILVVDRESRRVIEVLQ